MPEPTIPAVDPDFDTAETHVAAPTAGQLSDGFVLDEVPTSALFNYMFNAFGQWINWLQAKLSLFPGYLADTTLTIAAGVITPTAGNHAIQTEGSASSDDLTNILTTNLGVSRMLVLGCYNPVNVVVVKHAAGGDGQIHLANGLDYSLNSFNAILTLVRRGADWYEVSRSTLIDAEIPGTIKAYGGAAEPSGYFLCNGQEVSRATYAELFSVISTNYGQGDGVATFNVPNLQGRFLRGAANYPDVTGSGTASSDNATFTAHPYKQTGVKVRMASGALSGLSADTDYYVILIDANTLAFAVNRADSLTGTKISISGINTAVIRGWEDPDALTRVASTPGGATGDGPGSIEDDEFESHRHDVGALATSKFGSSAGNVFEVSAPNIQTSPTGGNETRPLNVAVNYIIKF